MDTVLIGILTDYGIIGYAELTGMYIMARVSITEFGVAVPETVSGFLETIRSGFRE